jgi:hypothetical protein
MFWAVAVTGYTLAAVFLNRMHLIQESPSDSLGEQLDARVKRENPCFRFPVKHGNAPMQHCLEP